MHTQKSHLQIYLKSLSKTQMYCFLSLNMNYPYEPKQSSGWGEEEAEEEEEYRVFKTKPLKMLHFLVENRREQFPVWNSNATSVSQQTRFHISSVQNQRNTTHNSPLDGRWDANKYDVSGKLFSVTKIEFFSK